MPPAGVGVQAPVALYATCDVVIMSPAPSAMEPARTAERRFFVHSSGFLALQSKHDVSYDHRAGSITLKLVEYAAAASRGVRWR